MRGIIISLAAAIALAAPANAGAKIEFAAYDGPDAVQTGSGGTKITKNGIDYWTSGTPPRSYKVIGRISDARDEEWDGGHAIGSPRIAKIVLKEGGTAVILDGQTDSGGGASGTGYAFFGMSKTRTHFIVIKYLDQ